MIFLKNAFLLQKFENMIPSLTFPMKAILSVFEKVKLAVKELKIPNLFNRIRI